MKSFPGFQEILALFLKTLLADSKQTQNDVRIKDRNTKGVSLPCG